MTKQQELEILDETIAALGRDSYLGPWLKEVRAEVERDVRCDLEPSPLPSRSRHEAESILADARSEAGRILGDASKKAADERSKAKLAADDERRRAARYIAEAQKKLGEMSGILA